MEICQCVTDLEVKKQGLAIYVALEGPARQACSNIDVKESHSENGVKIIIEKLKSLYAKDVNQAAFMAYEILKIFQDQRVCQFWITLTSLISFMKS